MISLAPVLGFSVLGIPSGDTQNTSDLGTGVPKTRGYPNHCDSGQRCGQPDSPTPQAREKALGTRLTIQEENVVSAGRPQVEFGMFSSL